VPKAQQAFEKVLAQRPNEPRSQFYLGLAAQQAGDLQAALQRWRELVAGAQPDAPYLDAVAQRMAQVERELGIEPGTTFAEVEPDAPAGGAATGQAAERSGAGGSGSRPRGPTREQMQAAQDMSPEQRQQMVQGMVQGLAARLAENPDDPAGWRRLIRSYVVLGREDDAREALTTALDTFQDRARTRRELINLARGLNLRLPEGVEPPPQTAQGGGQAGGTGQQGSGARGPTQQQMQAAQDMTPEQRQAMVRSMVERLRGRLEENPDNLQGWLQLGRSYDVLGQSEKAVEAYSQAAELAPEDPEVLGRYARAVRQDAGQQTQRSVELSRRVLELDPTNPEALWFTAMAELRQGNKNEARRLFDKALAQLPADTPQTAELRKRADEMLQSN
jgi:cytochrome c-type biogenesis protein CcmH